MKLSIKAQNFTVDSQITINKLFQPQPPRQCRICLVDQHQESDQKLITPCKCTGSVKYVHEECMKMWILSVFRRSQIIEKSNHPRILCQLCQTPIRFSYASKYAFNSIEEIKQQITNKGLSFVIQILVYLLLLGGLGYLSWKISDRYKNDEQERTIWICGVTLLMILLIVGTFLLVLQFLVKIQQKIVNIIVDETNERQLLKKRKQMLKFISLAYD